MERTEYLSDSLAVGALTKAVETVSMSLGGTAATIADTTTYPVAAQATKTEKVTVDGGSEQTVTFTNAISKGRILSSNSWPVADQDTKAFTITVDGGSAQTITIAGTTTTAAHVVAQINKQLSGATASVNGTAVQILSDSNGASSAIAATAGNTALTWASPAAVNTVEGIASQLAAQLEGVKVAVSGSQILMTTDSEGASSSIAIGTGTTDMTWASATAGTGQSGTVLKGTLLARNTSTKKLTVYSATGSNGTDEPVAVMPYEETWASAGDKEISVVKGGAVAKNMICVHDSAVAVDTLVFDKLHKNSGIVCVDCTDVSAYEN